MQMIYAVFWEITQRRVRAVIPYHTTIRIIPKQRRSHHHNRLKILDYDIFK